MLHFLNSFIVLSFEERKSILEMIYKDKDYFIKNNIAKLMG